MVPTPPRPVRSPVDLARVDPDRLHEADDRTFEAVMNADLRSTPREGMAAVSPELSAALRAPRNVRRWHAELQRAQVSVEGQLLASSHEYVVNRTQVARKLTAKRHSLATADSLAAGALEQEIARLEDRLLEMREDYNRDRMKKLRFLVGVREGVARSRRHVDELQASMYESVVADERDFYRRQVKELRSAVLRHRDAIETEEIDPNVYDLELWQVVADNP